MHEQDHVDEADLMRMLKGRLASLYHDMNNPLAVVSGNVQFMKELVAMGDPDGLEGALDDIQAAVAQLEDRLEDLLVVRRLLDTTETSRSAPPGD